MILKRKQGQICNSQPLVSITYYLTLNMLSNDRNCFVDQTVGKRDVEISMYMSQVGEITEV